MKQKYVISKDDNKLSIQEFAELDKDLMSLICEQTYDASLIEDAVKEGAAAVETAITGRNMYPPSIYLNKLAESVTELITSAEKESAEVYFDDIQLLVKNREDLEEEDPDDDTADIDDLLDDDDDARDDDFDDDDSITSIKSNSSIKIADDDSLDTEDL